MWEKQHLAVGYNKEKKKTRILTVYVHHGCRQVLSLHQNENGDLVAIELDEV